MINLTGKLSLVSEPHSKAYTGCKGNAVDKYFREGKLNKRKNEKVRKKRQNKPRKQIIQPVYSEGNKLQGQPIDD
jgi:hypothetical protein